MKTENQSPSLFSPHKNYTIVRVWLPKNSDGKFVTAHEASLNGTVGHVSLQTSEVYASFWPAEAAQKNRKTAAILGSRKGGFNNTYEDDLRDESGKSPDVVVVLNTLDTQAINNKFREFENSTTSKKWSLLGKNPFNFFNNGAGQSCSGLVYDLLNAGGIKQLASWDPVASAVTVAPDAVARTVIAASEDQIEKDISQRYSLPKGIEKRVEKPEGSLNPHKYVIQ